jgi:hypothetical protein
MNKIKQQILHLNDSPNIFARICFKIILKIYLFGKFCMNPQYRSEKISRFIYPEDIHQKSTFTKLKRYPVIFKICKDYINIKDDKTINILSFGCSTGEEVNSLRELFPHSIIYGVDINKYCLRKAKKNFKHPKNIFLHSLSKEFKNLTNLDIIFCLAVFQNSENRNNYEIKKSSYPFSKFQKQLKLLDKKLKKEGLLIIDHADFDFMETTVSKHYKPLEAKENRIIRNRPAFNRENIKVSSQTNFYRIFKKTD